MNENLGLLIQSGTPLIVIESTDEERALQTVQAAAGATGRRLFEWSMSRGLISLPASIKESKSREPGRVVQAAGKAADLLQYLLKNPEPGIYTLKDFGAHCKDALVHRLLRDLLNLATDRKMTLILVEAFPIPDELARFAVQFELGWPSGDEVEQAIRETFQTVRKGSSAEVTSSITRRDMDQLVQTLRGLSLREVSRVVSGAIHQDNVLCAEDLPRIVDFKRQVLSGSGCLESIAANFSADEIGGLEKLKQWLRTRRSGFTKKAREFGLESPRGVLMLGVPGCGKSLCAKVVAAEWGMPLLRLDPGTLYQKFVGETESQLRQALRQAESMAPAILWIDEIEKAFASASASSADGGLSQRMFGTLLSWMQDHRHPIFLVATANDISALPPELMRKGRFDEVFFVDLPNQEARELILNIHLKRRKQDANTIDVPELAALTDQFSGSELEQVVISGMFFAFQEQKTLEDRHLGQAIQETRPLAVLTAEKVNRLREWARNRCVNAD